MEWLADPTAWAGLATLVVLEIVLGIDNLIFIAILSDKLAPEQRQRARVVGLSLALLMRLGLLAGISWMTQLTAPLFDVLGHDISGRDLIMLVGGAFLLFKGTMELHEKLEGHHGRDTGPVKYAGFWAVIAQIVVLDAVFSLDAVITAVGMAEHLSVMMIAVCVAIALMMLAANPLMNFVSAHPTVVILCLGFLLMIGFSLIVEGLGFHIPKGYLYAAIGFSVLIEVFNQTALHNRMKNVRSIDARTRVSQAVLGLLGAKSADPGIRSEVKALAPRADETDIFDPQERLMINRVLNLSEQSVQAVMTPRHDLYWIDLKDDPETVRREIRECPYSCMIVAEDGKIEEPLGIVYKKDIADLFLDGATLNDLRRAIREPVAIPESMSALKAMTMLQESRVHVAFVIDEYGTLEGLMTLTDIAEAIAGEMPEEHEEDAFNYKKLKSGAILVNGALTLQELQEAVGPLEMPEGDFNTAAGVALQILQKVPEPGDRFSLPGWEVEIRRMDGRRVTRMKFTRPDTAPPAKEQKAAKD